MVSLAFGGVLADCVVVCGVWADVGAVCFCVSYLGRHRAGVVLVATLLWCSLCAVRCVLGLCVSDVVSVEDGDVSVV